MATPVLRTEFTNQTSQLYSLGWLAPEWSKPEEMKVAWLQRSVAAGQTYLQSQTAYKDLDIAISVIANTIREAMPLGNKMSDIQFNRLKRQVREIISTLTNLNPRWDYETGNEDLEQQTSILNKRRDYWWQTSFVDRVIKEALQWAILGAGYVHLVWGKPPYGPGMPDVVPRAFGLGDVIPDQIPRDGDIQRAYVIHIRDTMPFAMACAEFPEAARMGKIVPDRVVSGSSSSNVSPITKLISNWVAPIFRAIGIGSSVDTQMTELNNPFPEVDVFYSYISDRSVNESPEPVNCQDFTTGYGQRAQVRGKLWEYTVSPIGGEVPDGTFTISYADDGSQITTPNLRLATDEETLLYPLRRLVVWTNQSVLYDGPSPWWHGRVPLVKFTFDKWPWQFLGYNMIGENYSIQRTKTSMDRGIADMIELRIDPPLEFDENEYSRESMETMNMRNPGERIPKSGMVANAVKSILEWQSYEPPAAYVQIRQEWNQELDYILGVQDFSALAKLQQAPSAETIDRLLQAAGPLIADFARDMERSLTEMGYIFMWDILEFDTTGRRLRIHGRDGVTKEDFDFQPGSLIPASVPGLPSDAPLMRKGLLHGRQFVFNITPRSSFNVTDIQNKLFYLQLWRDPKNFPIDPWSLAKAWNLPNFGEPPADAINMIDRWKAWMTMLMEFQTVLSVQQQATAAMAMQQLMQSMPPEMLLQMGAAGMAQNAGVAPNQGAPMEGGGGREGRPPSGQEAPSLENKQDLEGRGPRSTIAES